MGARLLDDDVPHAASAVLGTPSLPLAHFAAHLTNAAQSLTSAEPFLTHAAAASPAERLRAMNRVQQLKRHLTILESGLVSAEHTAETWKHRGDKDLATYLGRVTREGLREGQQSVARATVLNDLPNVAEGFKEGALTTSHVDVVARALLNAPAHVVKELSSSRIQDKLVREAQNQAPARFARSLETLVAALSPQAVEDAHQAQFHKRHLHVTDTPDGTFVKGFFDRVSGHRVKLALEVLMHRPTKDDADEAGVKATCEQRTADALVAMADSVLNDGQLKMGALLRPHVSVVIQESTWKSLRSSKAPSMKSPGNKNANGKSAGTDSCGTDSRGIDSVFTPPPGSALDVTARLDGCEPVVDDFGMVMPPSEIGRILCDCSVTRMVVDQDSDLIDLGRGRRLYTHGQRRAVYLRDLGCAWQDCEMPVRWCDVHHSQWWSKGGGTDFDNGVAVCTFHHTLIHAKNLTVTRYRRDELDLEYERELSDQGRTLLKTRLAQRQLSESQISDSTESTLSGVGYIMTDPQGNVISQT